MFLFIRKSVLALVFMSAVMSFGSVSQQLFADESPDDLQKIKKQMEQMQEEINRLKTELKTVQKGVAGVDTPLVRPKIQDKIWELYGYVSTNVIYQNAKSTGAAGIDGIMWANRDFKSNEVDNDSQFSIHARNTRLGIKFSNLEKNNILWSAKIDGMIEWDFWRGGNPSRNDVRMRHAYLQAKWDNDFSILFGQYWDVISPLYPTSDFNLIMWNNGNLGDRRPQIRANWKHDFDGFGMELTGAILRTEAVGGQNLDGMNVNDGTESGRPMFQSRFGLSLPSWVKDDKMKLGVWGVSAKEETDTPIGTNMEKTFTASGFGADAEIPLWRGIFNDTDSIVLRGEFWNGKNLNDLRGGIGQGINTVTGEEIASQGGWAELKYKYNKHWNISAGYAIDNPDGTDLVFNTTSRRKNRTWYVTNWFDVGTNIKIGVVYERRKTDYFDALDEVDAKGEVDRLSFFFNYYF